MTVILMHYAQRLQMEVMIVYVNQDLKATEEAAQVTV